MGSKVTKTKKQSIRKDKRYRSKKKLVNEENFDEVTENGFQRNLSLRNISLEERRKEARKPLFLRRYE